MKKIIYMILILSPLLLLNNGTSSEVQPDLQNKNYSIRDHEDNVVYVYLDAIIDVNSLEDLSGFSSNIFIGKVSRLLYTDTNMEERILPHTYYEIEVLKDLKGNTTKEVILNHFGGYNDENILYLFQGNSLPIVGEYYIFITNELSDGTYYLETSTQKILLEKDDDLLETNYALIEEIILAIKNEVKPNFNKEG